MTKLTTERLEYYAALPTQPADGDGFFKKGIFMYEVRRMARQLLTYEQAAKNPVAWIVHMRTGDQFTTDSDFVGLGESTHGIHSTPLYAAPVLPKQPESESIICWSCKKTITLTQHAEADGFCPLCDAEIELEPTQPVIPGQLTQRMAEEKALSLGAVLYDEEAEVFADGWNACRAEMLKAQPVSEPYKLPDGYLLLPQVPTQAHLNSIAMRYRHDFYLLNDAQKQGALAVARQMYEECSGQGFYTVPAAPVQESE